MDIKKKREEAILDLIYKGRPHTSVTPAEEPDFTLRNTDGEFGVEVTEFYLSHSSARVKNIPYYIDDIISNQKYKHKDDITLLPVSEVTLVPNEPSRASHQIKGILQQQPPISNYVSKVAKLIEQKNEKFKNYYKTLNHINLIILDHENKLIGANKDKFHSLFFLPDLEKAITKSKFREIFFITKIGGFQSSEYVFIPLKMLFLVGEIFRFNHMLSKEYSKDPRIKLNHESVLCAEYLEWRGAKGIYIGDKKSNLKIVYGNSGISVSEENKVGIFDYNDFSLPKDTHPFILEKPSGIIDEKFKKIFNKHKKSYIFTTELSFRLTKSNPFPLV